MTAITPELQRLVEEAGAEPVRLEDPQTKEAFVLLRAEAYEKMKANLPQEVDPSYFEYEEFLPRDR
jgi:hypothetical protein